MSRPGARAARRRRDLAPILLVLLLLLSASAWLAIRGLAAARHLEAARSSLTAAQSALTDRQPATEATTDTTDAPAATDAAVARAGRDTARARALTGDPVWALVARLPGLGPSLRTTRQVTVAADDLARQVLPPLLTVAQSLEPAQLRRPDGALDVARLEEAASRLTAARQRLIDVRTALGAGSSRPVAAPVQTAAGSLLGQVARLDAALASAEQALQLASPLLGADRPRRYFVLVQQNGESRGTGGLAGGYAVVEADRGRLRVTAQGSNADLRDGPVPVPAGVPQDYVDLYGRNGAFQIWPNVNLSPDLPVVARVVAARWRAQSGQSVDGVVTVDAQALAMVLRGSGPIEAGGRQVPPDRLVDYLAVEQYRDASPGADQSRRKDQLAEVAATVAARVTSPGTALEPLLRGLSDAVRSGHLRMASDDPRLGPLLERSGVDGSLPRGPAPVAYPVVYNSAGGKLDHFLRRQVQYVAGPCAGDRRRSTITVALRNDAPATGLPPYLTIRVTPERVLDTSDSAVTLSVYGTRGAEIVRATLDGRPVAPEDPQGAFVTSTSEAGLPVWRVYLVLPRGERRVLALELDEPVVPGAARVPEQPLSQPLVQDVRVPACG